MAISSRALSCSSQIRVVSSVVVAAASSSSVAVTADAAAAATPPTTSLPPQSVSVVLLCGGSGKRMGASIPKQYLELCGRPIVAWSLRLFASMAEVKDVVVVCEPEYKKMISEHWAEACERAKQRELNKSNPELKWALPGAERQDSVQSGLAQIDSSSKLVAVHDSARPLTTAEDVRLCLSDAAGCGAAVLGVPVKPTIKEVNDDGTVARTLVRARLWEVQTPQVIEPELLRRGFAFAIERGLEVTDDVSVVELLGETVRITQGSYTNIKASFCFSWSWRESWRERERGRAGKETKKRKQKLGDEESKQIIF
jgi:2-C-methyl-D-erythritol 4-phosphate cytidylyltransferase